jgi:hypothetical protein
MRTGASLILNAFTVIFLLERELERATVQFEGRSGSVEDTVSYCCRFCAGCADYNISLS